MSLYNNQLTSIDVSQNTALTYLSLHDNQLTSIDVSQNTALTELSLSNNQLTSIDVSNNTNLNRLLVDENVEVTGANDNLDILYAPLYLFSGSDLRFSENQFGDGKEHEYTINVSNSIDKLVVGIDTANKGYYYNCSDDSVLCGGFYLFMLIEQAIGSGGVTINGENIDTIAYVEEVIDLSEEQCNNTYPCEVKKDDELVALLESQYNWKIYKNGEEIFTLNYDYQNGNQKEYIYLSELEVGKNVLIMDLGESGKYTINIIRSKKELNNDPNKELEDIAKDIVDSNNIDVVPDTGMFTAILLSILSIGIVVELYFVYYRKKVKN